MMFSRKPLTIAIRKPKPELSANQVNRQTRPRSAQPRRTRSSPWSFSIALRFSASIQPAQHQEPTEVRGGGLEMRFAVEALGERAERDEERAADDGVGAHDVRGLAEQAVRRGVEAHRHPPPGCERAERQRPEHARVVA